MSSARAVLRSILLFSFATTASFAQTTFATITGTVTDPNEAVVPNTTVEATHVQSNYRYTASSNQAGVYTLGQLRDGVYVLRAKAPGFKESVVENIQLVTLDVRRVDVRLEIGAVDTKVSVSAGATLIETETTRIGDTKNANLLSSLPLNTRSMSTWLNMVPTVNPMVGTSRARFAGSRGGQENYSIDGISVNSHQANSLGAMMGFMESFEEARLDSTNNSAEYGTVGQY